MQFRCSQMTNIYRQVALVHCDNYDDGDIYRLLSVECLRCQCWWFGYLNSACNPIIYAFRSQAFREGYRQVVCRGGKPRRK